MADRMEFPKTMKEFIEDFSFKDDKEIYTNGSQLIPTFRVEQALEHYGQEIRNKAIYEYMNLLCDHCMQQKNECYILECPFCTDGCDIVNIAKQLKAGGTDGSQTTSK